MLEWVWQRCLSGCGSIAEGCGVCPLVLLLGVLSCSRKTPDFDESDLTTLASGYTNASGGEHSCEMDGCGRVGWAWMCGVSVDVWGECGRVGWAWVCGVSVQVWSGVGWVCYPCVCVCNCYCVGKERRRSVN